MITATSMPMKHDDENNDDHDDVDDDDVDDGNDNNRQINISNTTGKQLSTTCIVQ